MGLTQAPAMEDRKVLCLQVGYFIRAVRPEQSPVESPLPSWKTADTPPAPATLMHFLPQEAIGFGTQFVEIRPDPSPDRDVPLSAQRELSNGAGGGGDSEGFTRLSSLEGPEPGSRSSIASC